MLRIMIASCWLLLGMLMCAADQLDGSAPVVTLFGDGIVAETGEAPIWDPITSRLLWIDIEGHRVMASDPVSGQTVVHALPAAPGTVVPSADGEWIVALKNGIFSYDSEERTIRQVAVPDDLTDAVRFNDGKCDPIGRFWVGTVDTVRYADPIAALYRLEGSTVTRVLGGVTISNGIAWSPDGTRMYYIDTPTRKVVAYDYDIATGGISNPEDAILIPEGWGDPDGCTMDADGMLWVALWGGHAIARWNPETGECLQRIRLPVKHVTAMAFGGEDLQTLFITTAKASWAGLDEPDAGKLFVCRPGAKGLKANVFDPVDKANP